MIILTACWCRCFMRLTVEYDNQYYMLSISHARFLVGIKRGETGCRHPDGRPQTGVWLPTIASPLLTRSRGTKASYPGGVLSLRGWGSVLKAGTWGSLVVPRAWGVETGSEPCLLTSSAAWWKQMIYWASLFVCLYSYSVFICFIFLSTREMIGGEWLCFRLTSASVWCFVNSSKWSLSLRWTEEHRVRACCC